MTDVEERLREALRAEANRRPVNTVAVQQRVEARLAERPTTRRRRASRRALPLLAAAAAAAAVAGTVAAVDRFRPDDLVGARQVNGGVDDNFLCPSRGRTVFDEDNADDSFLPELTKDLRPAGEAADLPRYEVEHLGDRVRVRFGNADGTLASVVVFRRAGDGYEPATVTKCTNGPGPEGPNAVPDRLPPGSRAGQFSAADFQPGAVKLFDTVTYDVDGLAYLRSVWAEPCGRTVCLYGGRTTSYVRGRFPPDEVEPSDATAFLYDPDTIVEQRTGYRLVVTYDWDNSLVAVSWRTKDGANTSVDPVTGGWPGVLLALVVPPDDFAGVPAPRVDRHEFFPAHEIT